MLKINFSGIPDKVEVRKIRREFMGTVNSGVRLKWEVQTVEKPKQLLFVEHTVQTKSFQDIAIKKKHSAPTIDSPKQLNFKANAFEIKPFMTNL